MIGNRARRQAQVELAMVRDGPDLNRSALARELGADRATIQRDIKAVRERWAALRMAEGEDLLAEVAGTAAVQAMIAREALGQYERLTRKGGEGTHHGAAIGYLRTALVATEQRAKLLGLADIGPEEVGEMKVIVEHEYPPGMEPIKVYTPARGRGVQNRE